MKQLWQKLKAKCGFGPEQEAEQVEAQPEAWTVYAVSTKDGGATGDPAQVQAFVDKFNEMPADTYRHRTDWSTRD